MGQALVQNQTMKTLGLIGGTSWHSTIEYYRIINQATNEHFGNNTNPPLLLFNLNQALIHQYQVEDNWLGIAELITKAANRLIVAGAEAIMFCANTPHKVCPTVESEISVPVLHIADATAQAIQARADDTVGFLGTKFTMNEDFVTRRIAQRGPDVIVPEDPEERDELHRIIQRELTFGQIKADSKQYVLESIAVMIDRGAKGIVLGCTEFPLMISENDVDVPVFNTTELHALSAVEFILQSNNAVPTSIGNQT